MTSHDSTLQHHVIADVDNSTDIDVLYALQQLSADNGIFNQANHGVSAVHNWV